MIKFGFNTLAMLTYGLGIAYPLAENPVIVISRPDIQFVEKPTGIDLEGKEIPILFDDEEIVYRDEAIKFKDR